MADFRKWFYALAFVALIVGLTAPANAQVTPFTCSAQAGVTPTVRAEGYTEQVGDLVLGCQGGQSTTAGAIVPGVDITIILNTNITSKITSGTFEDALLIIDEPNAPGPNSNRPILNCGAGTNAFTAPDTSPSSGPGVCAIFSDGNPADTYNGQAGVVGTAAGTVAAPVSVVCGAAGSPASVTSIASFGCGRPNVFQGRQGTVFNPQQFNAVTFNGVPIDPPGTGTTRTLRFTNVRADAEFLGVAPTFQPQTITMSVSTNGQTSIGINISQQVVAIIGHGLVVLTAASPNTGNIPFTRLDFVQCNSEAPTLSSTRTGPITGSGSGSFGGNTQAPGNEGFPYMRLQEGFANSWKPKNVSYYLANGNPNTAGQGYGYNGNTIVPTADNAQNVPGAIYNTESGFEFGSLGSVPAPNPPLGVGTTAVTGSTGLNAQAFNNGASPTSTNFSTVGSVTQGTRLAVSFMNVPSGSFVFVQPTLYLYRIGAVGAVAPTTSLTPNGLSSGVMVLTSTDAQGDTAINPTTTLGSQNLTQVSGGLAVWEILFADASASEEVDIPIFVSFVSNLSINLPAGSPNPNQASQVTASFAPFYGTNFSPNPKFPQSTSALPVPRFVPGANPLVAFEIQKCECNLLFPFVTNQAGFDTGIAIANTSQDPGSPTGQNGFIGTGPQQGSVTFYYYGVGAQGAAAPAPQTSANVPAGQVLTYDVFSGMGGIGNGPNGLNASAAGFQGYIIAQASFQYCHAYAFISALGIGATGQGISEGYLGIVLDNPGLPRTVQVGENKAH